MTPFKREKDVFPFVFGSLEVRGPNRKVGESGPYQVTSIREDIWGSLEWTVSGSIGISGERGNEEVARLYIFGCWNSDI
jgi:hypothetical protein